MAANYNVAIESPIESPASIAYYTHLYEYVDNYPSQDMQWLKIIEEKKKPPIVGKNVDQKQLTYIELSVDDICSSHLRGLAWMVRSIHFLLIIGSMYKVLQRSQEKVTMKKQLKNYAKRNVRRLQQERKAREERARKSIID
jgi:hypothetical protein